MAVRSARLIGNSTPRLDDKGRLIIPARYRPRFAEGLVITRGYDHVLWVYPPEEFDTKLAEFEQAPDSDAEARAMYRMLTWHAFEEELDRQGRLTIPPSLRKYAGIDRDVAVLGSGNRLEIVDLERFEAYDAEAAPRFANRDTGRSAPTTG